MKPVRVQLIYIGKRRAEELRMKSLFPQKDFFMRICYENMKFSCSFATE
jgi:hypothetical protein